MQDKTVYNDNGNECTNKSERKREMLLMSTYHFRDVGLLTLLTVL